MMISRVLILQCEKNEINLIYEETFYTTFFFDNGVGCLCC